MKMFLIKLLTGIAVFLTMYLAVLILNEDTMENTDEILTLNRKVESLEETLQAVKQQQDYLQIMQKGLRESLNSRTIEVDRRVEEAVDNKFKEQSATGGLGVLTNEQALATEEAVVE
jgi:regulator of replication initiation timing